MRAIEANRLLSTDTLVIVTRGLYEYIDKHYVYVVSSPEWDFGFTGSVIMKKT